MARRQLMLLSQRTISELLRSNSNHPRLRRHHACVMVIQDYRCDASITKVSPAYSLPVPSPIFKKICQHYNINVLFLSSDLQISTVGLWRILLRCSLEPSLLSISGTKSRNFPSTQCVPSHHAIVIRQSKSTVRRKAISLSSTKRVVSILQPNSVPVLYLAKNLHSSPYFSASIHSVPSISFATSQSGVELSVLSPSSAGSSGVQDGRITSCTDM